MLPARRSIARIGRNDLSGTHTWLWEIGARGVALRSTHGTGACRYACQCDGGTLCVGFALWGM